MKKFLFLLLIASSFNVAVRAQFNADKDPYMVKSLSTESFQKVLAETSGGNISVSGVSASEARIEVYIRGNNGITGSISKDEIEKRLNERYKLDISVADNQLTATAKQKSNFSDWKKGLSISFRVYVPEKISTKLSTSGGNISLNNLSGAQDFATSGGSLHIENVSGKIKGRTSGGSISLKNSGDDIDVATSGGSITANNCTGNVRLSTSGGSLALNDLKGKIDAQTSGGSVEGENIDGDLSAHTSGGNVRLSKLSCSLDASTSGGNISVEIEQLSRFVKLSNSGGNIALQIPKDKGVDLDLHGDKIKIDPLSNFSGSKDDDSVNGKMNGGGTLISVHAGSGRISLALK